VLHISTVGNAGGAGRAAFRLHEGLRRLGHESFVLTGYPIGLEPGIDHLRSTALANSSLFSAAMDRVGRPLDQLLGTGRWSWRGAGRIADLDLFKHADVINIHNVHGGYFNVRALAELARRKPVVWTLHDMWALTGHCAYSYECDRWQEGCHECPLIRGEARRLVEPAPPLIDRTRAVWHLKREIYQSVPLHVVTPSAWLEGLVRQSILRSASSIHRIPYGLDLARFAPSDPASARQELRLPLDARVIMFSADRVQNPRKGLEYLCAALALIKDPCATWLLISGDGPDLALSSLPVHVRSLGYVSDERLQRLALAAADICVSPTLADNFPLTLMESLACGTPVVAFDVGGVREIVQHLYTGYLARSRNVEDLAHGIDVLLGDDGLRHRLSVSCREMAERLFPLELAAGRYTDVYQHALGRDARGGLTDERQ